MIIMMLSTTATISNALRIFKSFNHDTQPLPSNPPFPPNLSRTVSRYHLAIIPSKIIGPFAKFITPRRSLLFAAPDGRIISTKNRGSAVRKEYIKSGGVSCPRREAIAESVLRWLLQIPEIPSYVRSTAALDGGFMSDGL
jgi:hypothetical protein